MLFPALAMAGSAFAQDVLQLEGSAIAPLVSNPIELKLGDVKTVAPEVKNLQIDFSFDQTSSDQLNLQDQSSINSISLDASALVLPTLNHQTSTLNPASFNAEGVEKAQSNGLFSSNTTLNKPANIHNVSAVVTNDFHSSLERDIKSKFGNSVSVTELIGGHKGKVLIKGKNIASLGSGDDQGHKAVKNFVENNSDLLVLSKLGALTLIEIISNNDDHKRYIFKSIDDGFEVENSEVKVLVDNNDVVKEVTYQPLESKIKVHLLAGNAVNESALAGESLVSKKSILNKLNTLIEGIYLSNGAEIKSLHHTTKRFVDNNTNKKYWEVKSIVNEIGRKGRCHYRFSLDAFNGDYLSKEVYIDGNNSPVCNAKLLD